MELAKELTIIDRLSVIWKSDLTNKKRRNFFQAAVVSILLYWWSTLTLTITKTIFNMSWKQHPTKTQLYGHLPPITKTINIQRNRHAEHCWKSYDDFISDVLLWTPLHRRSKARQPTRTYIEQLFADTGCSLKYFPRGMDDRDGWWEGQHEMVIIYIYI